MNKEKMISDSHLYELILNTKHHEEIRRDEINKYFTSLFTAIVSIMPIVEKIIGSKEVRDMHYLNIFFIVISIIGVTASISWILILIRIYNYLDIFDKLLIEIEQKHTQKFISYVSLQLKKIHSPGRVTKQNMLLPFIFCIIFIISLIYNIFVYCKNIKIC